MAVTMGLMVWMAGSMEGHLPLSCCRLLQRVGEAGIAGRHSLLNSGEGGSPRGHSWIGQAVSCGSPLEFPGALVLGGRIRLR